MKKNTTNKIVKTALVAGLYAAMTLAIAPLSYGPVQFRFSEVLTLLAFISPQYVLGLTIGCLLANIGSLFFTTMGVADIVFGTAATFISVYMMSRTKNFYVATLWPTLVNGVVIGALLYFFMNIPFAAGAASVAMGEFVVVSIVGTLVFKFGIMKNKKVMAILKDF